MNRKNKRVAGAFAIETVISLTVFMLAILSLMMGAMLIRAQAMMQYALNQTAKEMSGYFYLLDKIGVASMVSGKETDNAAANIQVLNDSIDNIVSFSGGMSEDLNEMVQSGKQIAEDAKSGCLTDDDIKRIKNFPKKAEELEKACQDEAKAIKEYLNSIKEDKALIFQGVLQVFGKTMLNTALSKYVTPLVCEFLMPKYLTEGKQSTFFNATGIIEDSIDFDGSKMLEDGRTISLVVTYKIDASKLTLGFYNKELQFHQVACTSAWVRKNDSGSLVSLSDVADYFDVARKEDRAEELRQRKAANDAKRAAQEKLESEFKSELEKHEVDETEEKPKEESKDDKKEEIKLPPGASGSDAFMKAFERLSDGDKKDYIYNYNYLKEHYNIELTKVIEQCGDKDAALKLVVDNAFNGGLLLANTGNDGLCAYQQLDPQYRNLLLYGIIKPNSPEAKVLVNYILNEKLKKITDKDLNGILGIKDEEKASSANGEDKEGKVTLPAGVNGNDAFLKAYDKLTDAQKEQYNKLQASVKKRPPYEYDLTAVLNGCSDKDAVLQFLLQEKHPEDVAWILAVYGESGFEAYQKLDADSREFLLNGPWRTGSTSDGDLIKLNRELLNLILDENRSKITMADMKKIQEAADKKTKPGDGKDKDKVEIPAKLKTYVPENSSQQIVDVVSKLDDTKLKRLQQYYPTSDTELWDILNSAGSNTERLLDYLVNDQQKDTKKIGSNMQGKLELIKQFGENGRTVTAGDITVHMNSEKLFDILEQERGKRENPKEYLGQEYIDNHLKEFEDEGFVVIQASWAFDDFTKKKGTVGYDDNTQFVLPKSKYKEVFDRAEAALKTGGKKAYVESIEKDLGYEVGKYFGTDPIYAIEVPPEDAKKLNLRMPDGNELGASGYWVPGGYTSGGTKEAVCDKFTVKQGYVHMKFDGEKIPENEVIDFGVKQ